MFTNILKSILPGKQIEPDMLIDAPQDLIKAYNQSRDPALRKSFCYAPSVNMLFSGDGSVKACCHNKDFSIGNYPQQSIQEIWNSNKAQEFRERMTRYDLSEGCRVCEADFKSGNFEEVSARHFDTIPVNLEFPTMMEFWLSNTCNLECVMCTGELSSSIRKNRDKLPPIPGPYDQQFLDQLKEFIPHLREARFSGSGEAFLIDMYFDIWEMLIEHNPNCVIMVQTNGTVMNGRIRDILDRGNFRIGISLDSLTKETYESIRVNARLDRVIENIRFFSDYSNKRNQAFNIAMCVMRQNWQELPEFVKFCNQVSARLTFHKVWYPGEYALYNLPADELKKIHDHLASFKFSANTALEKMNARHYEYFTSVIHQWITSSPERDNQIAIVSSLNSSELIPYLRSRIKSYLERKNDPSMEEKEILELSMNKLQEMISRYQEENEREKLMRKICLVPPADMMTALKTFSIDTLFQKSKKF